MGNLNLDDTLGYFRELVDPNFCEFYYDYQSPEKYGRDRLVRVFRKMVNLCLTLNHQTDKVVYKLGFKSSKDLISKVRKFYPSEGSALDAVRLFSNDIKHKSKLDQNCTSRKRSTRDQNREGADLPEWFFITREGERIAICSAVIDAYIFWGKWFAGERSLLKKKRIAECIS